MSRTPGDGIALIGAERNRQTALGYGLEHDADFHGGSTDLESAAVVYALWRIYGAGSPDAMQIGLRAIWPWDAERLEKLAQMPRLEALMKAGALIAAAIDQEIRST